MNKKEKAVRDKGRNDQVCSNPSFSSTLLDQIYRSIDGGEKRNEEPKVFRETMPEKQSRSMEKSRRQTEEEENLRRACLIDRWMEKTVSERSRDQRRRNDYDQDVLFWSSTSSSSESSSGGFSSSDSETIFALKSMPSACFATARPKPIRTGASSLPGNSATKLRDWRMLDDYHSSFATERTPKLEERTIQTKSKALRIYGNLKKVKQPISPGGRLSSFLNSLFPSGNAKKTKTPLMMEKASEASICSSASSFSRSCLSKNSHPSSEKLRNAVKRTVRFYPVSIIVDEDCKPCGHKSLFEDDSSSLMPVAIPTAWRIESSSTRKNNDEPELQATEQKKKDSQQTQKLNDSVFKEFSLNDDEDDDAASCSSSDLFELDHLAVIGGERYREDLPVYETTSIDYNRAIANVVLHIIVDGQMANGYLHIQQILKEKGKVEQGRGKAKRRRNCKIRDRFHKQDERERLERERKRARQIVAHGNREKWRDLKGDFCFLSQWIILLLQRCASISFPK